MITSESLVNFAPAFVAAQKAMSNAPKDKVNPHFKSRYADLSSVLDSVRPALNQHGISITGGIQTEASGHVTVTVRLVHQSGEWIQASASAVGRDTSPQSMGSTTTYLRRYLTQAITGISSDDDDGEAAERPPRPAAKPVAAVRRPEPTVEEREEFELKVIDAINATKLPQEQVEEQLRAALLKKGWQTVGSVPPEAQQGVLKWLTSLKGSATNGIVQ